MAMEASFKSRVEHIFGALLGSSLQSGHHASSQSNVARGSWSVREVAAPSVLGSEDEHESSDDDEPCAARYENFVRLSKRGRRGHFSDDDDGEDDVEQGRVGKRRRSGMSSESQGSTGAEGEDLDEDEECRQVRLMVGMDDTLDFEEEEDEYDKVAVGREGAGERVYMREITRAGSELDPVNLGTVSNGVGTGRHFERDARANHAAAAARLREDDKLAATRSAEMLRLPCPPSTSRTTGPSGDDQNVRDADIVLGCSVDVVGDGITKADTSNCDKTGKVEPRSSIACPSGQRKESAMEPVTLQEQQRSTENLQGQHDRGPETVRKYKKVRFSLDDDSSQEKESSSRREGQEIMVGPVSRNKYTRVPDHVRNPSRYTYYTLEWSDEEDDNRENLAAFKATRALSEASEKDEVMGTIDLPKSITFTPRSGGISSKVDGEVKVGTGSGLQQGQPLVSFAGDGALDDSLILEDSQNLQGTIASKMQMETKTARVFRKRAREEENN